MIKESIIPPLSLLSSMWAPLQKQHCVKHVHVYVYHIYALHAKGNSCTMALGYNIPEGFILYKQCV